MKASNLIVFPTVLLVAVTGSKGGGWPSAQVNHFGTNAAAAATTATTTTTRGSVSKCASGLLSNSCVGRIKACSCNRLLSSTLTKSMPALSVGKHDSGRPKTITTIEVSTKIRSRSKIQEKIASSIPSIGVYYGIEPDKMYGSSGDGDGSGAKSPPKPKKMKLSDTMSETLLELRNMREELHALREEMREMKQKLTSGEEGVILLESGDDDGDGDFSGTVDDGDSNSGVFLARTKRQREFEKVGKEVERWAKKLLFEEEREGNGWVEVQCNKMVRKSFNREGKTKAYLKWMKDSRGKHAKEGDGREYPCIKIFSIIDAPVEEVCTYLSQEQHLPEYNDLVVANRDLEDISPHSKICWGQTPQILFVKPRDFVTYCHHRFLPDGTQVLINQACDHPDIPACHEERGDKACRAYALRGANFISRDPDDPEKTRFAMLAHGSPGGDIPQWACKTAINALAPIEPFKLFHKINTNVKLLRPQIQERLEQIKMVSNPGQGKCRPAGMAQLGYACFWPDGAKVSSGAASSAASSAATATATKTSGSMMSTTASGGGNINIPQPTKKESNGEGESKEEEKKNDSSNNHNNNNIPSTTGTTASTVQQQQQQQGLSSQQQQQQQQQQQRQQQQLSNFNSDSTRYSSMMEETATIQENMAKEVKRITTSN